MRLMRYEFRLVVISDKDISGDLASFGLNDLHEEVIYGHSSGELSLFSLVPLTEKQAEEELIAQGTDPSFLLGDDDDE